MTQVYKKVTLYYFSGTGNAKTAAYWVAEDAKAQGLDVTLENMDRTDPKKIIPPDNGTLVGFFYPTHGFNAPPLVINFLRHFPKTRQGHVFWVNTRGGAKIGKWNTPGLSGIAQYLPAAILKFKGYQTVGWRPLDLPSNWLSLHPAIRGSAIDFIFANCKKVITSFSQKTLSGQKVYRGLWDLPIDLLIGPIAVLYFMYGRFALAKTFMATNSCNHCGSCIKKCPTNAIKKIRGRLYWKFSCESCMRCLNNCPKNAIETAHGITAGTWWLAFSIIPFYLTHCLLEQYLYQFISPNPLIDLAFKFITAGVGLLALYICYGCLHFLMKLNPVNKFVAWTSLTHYTFWGRYKAPKKFRVLK